MRNYVKKTLHTDIDTEIAASEMYYVHGLSAGFGSLLLRNKRPQNVVTWNNHILLPLIIVVLAGFS